MRNVMSKIKDWIWDVLFLDFYLDKSWTFRFKILNLLSGDALREYLTSVHICLEQFEKYKDMDKPEAAAFYAKRAKYWADIAWNYSRKGDL